MSNKYTFDIFLDIIDELDIKFINYSDSYSEYTHFLKSEKINYEKMYLLLEHKMSLQNMFITLKKLKKNILYCYIAIKDSFLEFGLIDDTNKLYDIYSFKINNLELKKYSKKHKCLRFISKLFEK